MIILGEVSQREQDKYYIILLLHGIYNMTQMNLFMKHTHRPSNKTQSYQKRGEKGWSGRLGLTDANSYTYDG